MAMPETTAISDPIYFQDERIVVWPLSVEHASLLARWMNDQRTTYFLFSGRVPRSEEDFADEIRRLTSVGNNALFLFGITEGHIPVGFGGLYDGHWIDHKAEFRLFIGEAQHRGKGLGTYISSWLVDYGFSRLNLHRIWLGVNSDNVFAIVAYQQAGFQTEARLQEDCARNAALYDSVRMAILRPRWEWRNGIIPERRCACGCGRRIWRRPVILAPGHHTRLDFASEFWRRVKKGAGCWEWLGTRIASGYGVVEFGPKARTTAHRFAYELVYGYVPANLHVCHHCDNRGCVRPDHLFPGTPSDNLRDAVSKGRVVPPTPPKLTAQNVKEIRESSESNDSLGAKYGVDRSTIWSARTGRSWQGIK